MRVTAGRHVFIWLALALLPAFGITAVVARAHKATQRELAGQWTARGESALARHEPDAAIDAFRNALIYNRENRLTRLRLAQALVAAGRTSEARAHLLTLWEDQPGNGPVNLELGRLAAAEQDRSTALRHYHNAIEGAWLDDPERHRRETRLELSEFLLRDGAVPQAQAELITLAADLPPSPEMRKRVAALLVTADLPERGLPLFESLARSDPADRDAAGGAGHAAFALGNDLLAARYLSSAVSDGAADPALRRMLQTSQLALEADPFARRLSSAERAARVTRALDAAQQRLSCAVIGDADRQPLLGEITFVRQIVTPAALRVEPESLDAAMNVVLRAERLAGDRCPPAPLDSALIRILERRQKSEG